MRVRPNLGCERGSLRRGGGPDRHLTVPVLFYAVSWPQGPAIGDFSGPIHRFKESPGCPGQPPLSEEDGELVMHVALPILGGHVLMGTDAPASMGFTLVQGNNSYLNLEPDSRGETDRLFAALAEGGKVEMPLAEMFWGDYFGSLVDKFGTHWMFNCQSKT
ncbi:VOC family protein [Aeromonas caviae]|uniref:VOC family protein n=2 Tax=Aeromonas caviae TaxID=648 RepID=UPI002B47705F|nr:VOC family protein [Aeromonas caviae]